MDAARHFDDQVNKYSNHVLIETEEEQWSYKEVQDKMYKTSGENVSPKAVEDIISQHPTVSQVYVVGIPDAIMGEVGVACVELKDGEEATRAEIIAFCRDKMARYKIPRHVVFMKASEFPMTSTGKVKKFQLAKMMSEQLREKRSKTEA